jgi:NAD(P)H dehydrogenase (quinone)
MTQMADLLIVYYSRSGNTKAMAEHVAAGAAEVAGLKADVRAVSETTPDDLLQADAVIIGSPVYYGTMAADIKQLIDESVCHHGKLDGKVGGAFASSGGLAGGNETTVLDIVKALMVHGMVVKGEPTGDHYGPVAVGAPDDRSQRECRKYGKMVGDLTQRLHG